MSTQSFLMSVGVALSIVMAGGAHAADKVNLAPKYKKDDKITFTQHTVRSNTMVVGGSLPKPAPAAEGGKEEAKPAGEGKVELQGEQPKDASATPSAPPTGDKPGNIQQNSQGMSMTDTIDQTATYELRVVDAGPSGHRMELELKSIKGTATIPSGEHKWDSDAPRDDSENNNAIAITYRPIIGAVLKITTDANGNITSVAPDSRVNLNAKGPLAPMVQAMVGPDLVRLRFAPIIAIKDSPADVTVGDTWKSVQETVSAQMGRIVTTTNSTLKSVDGDTAKIDISGDLAILPIDENKPAQGKVRDHSLKGGAEWDLKSGLMSKHSWDQQQTIDINAMGFAITRSTNMKVTTTRK